MSKPLPIQKVLTDEFLCAMGLVVAEWAKAERTIFVALMLTGLSGSDSLAKGSSAGFAVLLGSGMDVRTAMGILKGLFRLALKNDEPEFEAFNKLFNRFGKLYGRRNVVAHGAWRKGKRPKSIESTSLKTVGDIDAETSNYTALELVALAHRIHAFRVDLIKFLQKHRLAPRSTSPETLMEAGTL
jgi:hypothetical protein